MHKLTHPLALQLLEGEFRLTTRPEPVRADMRMSWGIALVVLMLGSCRGNKASLQKLHFLAHAIRSTGSRNETLQVFSGARRTADLATRVEPWLNRVLSLAAASRLIELPKGKSAALTKLGVTTHAALMAVDSLFSEERLFLSAIAKHATESAVERILRMENL